MAEPGSNNIFDELAGAKASGDTKYSGYLQDMLDYSNKTYGGDFTQTAMGTPKPDASELPSADDIFGSSEPAQAATPAQAPSSSGEIPSADDIFGAPEPPNWAAQADQSIQRSLTRIQNAFGIQARAGFGEEPVAGPSTVLSKETEQALKDAGVFNDYTKGQKAFDKAADEALVRGTASALTLGARAFSGLASGVLGAAGQTLEELGLAQPGKGAGELTGALTDPGVLALTGGLGAAGELEAMANARRLENLRVDASKWRAAGMTAEGEAGFYDAVPLSPANAQARVDAANEAGVPVPVPRPPPKDVHELARRIEPDVFRQFDALAEERAVHRDAIAKLGAEREASPEATAARQEIDTILGKVHGVEDRLTGAARTRLAAAQERLDTALRTDTPEMAEARQALLASDFKMRDLAPDVSSAYAQAREMLPETQATAQAEELVQATKPASEAVAEVAPKAPELAPEAAGATEGEVAAGAIAGEKPPITTRAAPRTSNALRAVEGTGELQTRTLAEGVEASAIEGKLTESFGDLPEYHQLNMADQAAKASELINSDYETAKAVALGRAQPPRDVLPESVFVALEKHALAAGDVETLRQLATESKLTTAATTMGQRIRTLGERDPASPVGALQEIARAREAAVTRTVASKDIAQAKAEVESEIRAEMAAARSTRADWSAYIDQIRCKE